MSPENFVYWLRGYLEIQDPTSINANQVQIIKDYLQLVFKKETQNYTIKNNNFYHSGAERTLGVEFSDKLPKIVNENQVFAEYPNFNFTGSC